MRRILSQPNRRCIQGGVATSWDTILNSKRIGFSRFGAVGDDYFRCRSQPSSWQSARPIMTGPGNCAATSPGTRSRGLHRLVSFNRKEIIYGYTGKDRKIKRSWSSSHFSSHTNASSSSYVKLNETTSLLRNLENGAEIFLIGTAHVSDKSVKEVVELIDKVRPDVVMVELCEKRGQKILADGKLHIGERLLRDLFGSLLSPTMSFREKIIKMGFSGLYGILEALGFSPGAEFRAAIEAAKRHNARVIYGDRDIATTMRRLSESINLRDVVSLINSGIPSPPKSMVDTRLNKHSEKEFNMHSTKSEMELRIEDMKNRGMVIEIANFLNNMNPNLANALLHERDEFMTQSLRALQGRVVGVVGLAHLDGIEKRWETYQGRRSNVSPAMKLLHRRDFTKI